MEDRRGDMLMEFERRNSARYCVRDMETVFRQCDLTITNGRKSCDAIIENLSDKGVCLRFDCAEDLAGLTLGEELFFHGCIFNNLVGFLSSATGVVRWVRDGLCGLTFTKPLDVSPEELRYALSADNDYLRGYSG